MLLIKGIKKEKLMAEILITRIPNSRDADKVGIELESILRRTIFL